LNIILEILFTLLVLADMAITYAMLERGGYREVGAGKYSPMRFLIKYPAAAIVVTLLAVAALFTFLLWAEWYFEIPAFLALIPASGVFALVCWRNWKIWRA
jgi:4-hydroxybenzoate polyprenyltransferase